MKNWKAPAFILRHAIDAEREEVMSTSMDDKGRRGLLVFASPEEAKGIAKQGGMEELQPHPITAATIEETCKGHGFVLVGFWGLDTEDDISVFTSENAVALLEEMEERG